jgi:hypothetical protein
MPSIIVSVPWPVCCYKIGLVCLKLFHLSKGPFALAKTGTRETD